MMQDPASLVVSVSKDVPLGPLVTGPYLLPPCVCLKLLPSGGAC